MLAAYDLILAKQKPIVLLLGDKGYKDYQEIQNLVESEVIQFSLPLASRKAVDLIQSDIPEYMPHVADFLGSESKKVGMYMSIPPIEGLEMLSYTILTSRLISELIFEYIRNIEKADYEPEHAPRITSHSYEFAWSFRTSTSSEMILYLMEQLFYMDKKKFEFLREKVYYDQLLRLESQYDTSYWIIQYYAKYGKVRTIPETAKEVLKISYEEFKDFYYGYCFPLISLEVLG